MDHYPEINVSERECASRQPSSSSSLNNGATQVHISQSTQNGQLAPPVYTSFPPPSSSNTASEQEQHYNEEQPHLRTDSVHSSSDSSSSPTKSRMEADLQRYTNAPPPYSAKQYEGKSEEVQNKMRMADYAKEIKRMMGRQLARGIRSGETKV